MPKLVVHIGRPKTGTTAFQHFLWLNREQLAAHHVGYPTFNRSQNHQELAGLSRPLRDRLNLQRQLRTEADRARLWRTVRADLERLGAIESNVATILTNEHLATNRHPGQVESFANLVKGTHDDLVIVAFVRRADYLSASYYSQLTKAGQRWDFDADFVRRFWRAFDHRQVADRWRSVFGDDKVVFYPYLERFKTDYFAVAARIFEQMQVQTDPTDGWLWTPTAVAGNQQLSALASVYLSELNEYVPPRRTDGTTNAVMRNLLMEKLGQRFPGEESIGVPNEVRAKLAEVAPAEQIVDHLGGWQGPHPELWQEWLDQPDAPSGEMPAVDEAELQAIKAELFAPHGPIQTGGDPLPEPVLRKWGRRGRKLLGIGRKPITSADLEDE